MALNLFKRMLCIRRRSNIKIFNDLIRIHIILQPINCLENNYLLHLLYQIVFGRRNSSTFFSKRESIFFSLFFFIDQVLESIQRVYAYTAFINTKGYTPSVAQLRPLQRISWPAKMCVRNPTAATRRTPEIMCLLFVQKNNFKYRMYIFSSY